MNSISVGGIETYKGMVENMWALKTLQKLSYNIILLQKFWKAMPIRDLPKALQSVIYEDPRHEC